MTAGGATLGIAIDTALNGPMLSQKYDDDSSGGREKKRQGDNTAKGKEYRDAVREIEKNLGGEKLTEDQLNQLHDEIHGKGYEFKDIVRTGMELFGSSE